LLDRGSAVLYPRRFFCLLSAVLAGQQLLDLGNQLRNPCLLGGDVGGPMGYIVIVRALPRLVQTPGSVKPRGFCLWHCITESAPGASLCDRLPTVGSYTAPNTRDLQARHRRHSPLSQIARDRAVGRPAHQRAWGLSPGPRFAVLEAHQRDDAGRGTMRTR